MNHKIMLNSNLLRNDRWEWLPTKFGKPMEISNDLTNRLREVISPYVTRFYQNRVTRSLFTNSRKKQIAFIISQICLMICIFILLVNIPPILGQLLTAEDIFVLGTKIISLVLYLVVLGFLFFLLIVIWHSIYKKYKEDHPNIEKYLRFPDMDSLIEHHDQFAPKVTIWVESNEGSILNKLGELIDLEKKTLILCDKLVLGRSIAKLFDIPFVSGNIKSIKERLQIIQDNKVVIVNRIIDGISIKDFQVFIDVNSLLGSRQQEVQRIIRESYHPENREYHLLITDSEYNRRNKQITSMIRFNHKTLLNINPDIKHYFFWKIGEQDEQ